MTDPYEQGSWSCAYQVSPVVEPLSLPALRQIMIEVTGSETGWPVWISIDGREGMGQYIAGETIECWMKNTGDGDFWRVHPEGRLFLIRRFQEDHSFKGVPAGAFLDLTLPVWRTGECLLHAARFAPRLGADWVDMTMTWRGLAGRHLRALASPGRALMRGRVCADADVTTNISTAVGDIADTLPELVKALVAPLFARFEFFEPPDSLYSEEIHRMRNRT